MMKYEATVGIFMPAFRYGEFVDDAIRSLKKQTFQDFVVHVVDDGSDDKTVDKLKFIDYDKARVFLNRDNKGVAFRARQHYKMFNTKYVMVLCADDVLAPEFLEKTVDFLEENAEYGAVSTNIRLFTKRPDDFYAQKSFDAKLMDLKHVLARNQVLGSSLMRKKALNETDLSGGFTRYQDWDRWISMLEAGWKIGLVPEFLFYYRQVPTSLSHSATIENELEMRKKLLKKHAESYRKYYEDIILNMEYAFLEVQEGKNWLEGQYYNLNREVERLNTELKKCVNPVYRVKKVARKIKGKIIK